MSQRHLVILCGGEGKRLWPLATPEHPKQFLSWTENTTLFDETILRLQPLLDEGVQLHVVTQKKYFHFFEQYSKRIKTIVEEDVSRNTAPAILHALISIFNENFNDTFVFLPADHYFKDKEVFVQSVENMFLFSENYNSLVCMGVAPLYPATEYGYIEVQSEQERARVKHFYEKPDAESAKEYVNDKNFYWNIGMYGGTAGTFIEQYKKYTPELFDLYFLYKENKISYEKITHISFDYAIAEKTNEMLFLSYEGEWSDVGSLDVFLRLVPWVERYQKYGEKREKNVFL